MTDDRPKESLSSLEAAALFLSEGKTSDPQVASIMANEKTFDMDGMQKSHLRRMMGFDFKVKIDTRKILITSKDEHQMRARCRVLPGELDAYGNIISEDLIDRLVDACLRLKTRWDKVQADD